MERKSARLRGDNVNVYQKKMMITIVVIATAFIALLAFAISAHAEPAGTYIYVSNYNSDTITVIDAITFQRAADIKTDNSPSDIIVNPAGTYLYVAYDGAPYVDVFSTVDYSRSARIRLTDNATGFQYTRMSMNGDGTKLYVTVYGDYALYVVDIVSNTVVKQKYFEVGGFPEGPYGVLYHNGFVYVSLFTSSTVLKLNAETLAVTTTYASPLTDGPNTIVYDDYSNWILVNNNNATVTAINAGTGVAAGILNMTTGGGAVGSVSVNSSGYIYKSDYTNGNVTIFKSDKTILTNVTGITNAAGIICNNYNDTVFVAANTIGRLYIIDGVTILGYVEVGSNPYRVALGTQSTVLEHQVKFVVQSKFGIFKYDNVTVTVYDETGALKYSKATDTSGQVAFYLSPTNSYTVWANSTTDNINESMIVYPYETTYYFAVWSFYVNWNPFGWVQNAFTGWGGPGLGDVNKDVRMNYSVNTTSDPRVITLNYTDYTASTSAVNFTLLRWWQENGTYSTYNTTVISGTDIEFQQLAVNVQDEDADGESYKIVVTATTESYGVVKRMDDYHFKGVAYPMPGLPTEWYPYIAFGIIVLFGLFFTYISSGLGLIVMAFWGVIFLFMGWLEWSNTLLLLLQVLAVFGIGQIFKMRRQREGV